MIDWNKFKNGKLSVILRTKELAEDFYKKCKERGIDWNGNIDYAIWREGGVKYTYDTLFNILVWGDIEKDKIIECLEWGGSNKMEKTFREVIRDIKEGEVWENPVAPISFIRLRADGVLDFNENEGINLNVKYSLQRKQYTFEEAFKAYEEGKEIESCFSSQKFRIYAWEDVFNAKEIKEKWYIND